MERKFIYWAVILAAIIIQINGKPECKIQSRRTVICTPGSEDYFLDRGLVSDNNRTNSIILKGCRITDIGLNAFTGLRNLKHLDLSENKIAHLELGSLDDAKSVTHLNLSHNLLTNLTLGLLDQKKNLEVLDLKGNKIENFVLGVFDQLSKLKHLDLSSNELLGSELDPYIFDQSRGIMLIDFSRNDMEDSPDILLHAFRSINFLNLDRCMLKSVPKFATAANLKTMKHLMLSTNLITELNNASTFNNLDELEILNLAENSIENVNENVFKPLKKLQVIVLRNNIIKYMSETLFTNMNKLNTINLSHNLIETVPINAFRGTGMKNLNLADNRFSYLTDNFILELRNSGAYLTKFFFNQNPWQCACLRDLIREVKSFGITYNKSKYTGKNVVCVTTKMFICQRHLNFNDMYVAMYNNLHGKVENK